MANWEKLMKNAFEHKSKSELFLAKAVRELMKTKGFSEEQCALFDACFAGGTETIVTFNNDGEDNDFGLENYCSMTKEEIVKYMSKFLKESNVELFKN